MKNLGKNIFFWLIVGSLAFMLLENYQMGASKEELSFTEFKNEVKAKKVISEFKKELMKTDKLSREILEPIINNLIKTNNTNFKGVGQPLRIALTGSKFGPGIYDIIISLGKEEVSKRLVNKKLS